MRDSPRTAARRVLFNLHAKVSRDLGHRPSEAEFFPVKVEDIVSMVGWELRPISNMTERGEQLAGRVDFQKKMLYVEKEDRTPRQKFTIAHEIGHIVLQHSCSMAFRPVEPHSVLRPHTLGVPSRSTVVQEREANAFAAELLMPERAVRREFLKRFGNSEVRVGSEKAQEIVAKLQTRGEDLAADLAVIKYPSANISSLVEFFLVSRSAMSGRLLELSLVY